MREVESRVKQIVANHLGVAEAAVTNEASFTDDLCADSLDTVELIMAFEEEFEVEITYDQAQSIRNVGDAVGIITKAR
ncbi:acyl carrier protein [Sinorhizobium meliloti]|nr:acyl carrier protein [Sinorhizobium meliloti]